MKMNLNRLDKKTMAEAIAIDSFVVKENMPIRIGIRIIPPPMPPRLATAKRIGRSI